MYMAVMDYSACTRCFFLQAEDGIRVTSVTVVQTCALPIYFVHLARYTHLDEVNSAGQTDSAKSEGDRKSVV